MVPDSHIQRTNTRLRINPLVYGMIAINNIAYDNIKRNIKKWFPLPNEN